MEPPRLIDKHRRYLARFHFVASMEIPSTLLRRSGGAQESVGSIPSIPKTKFFITVPDLVGVVVSFLPTGWQLDARRVSRRWDDGVCGSVIKLRLSRAVSIASLPTLVVRFPEVRTVALKYPLTAKERFSALATLRALEGLTSLLIDCSALGRDACDLLVTFTGLTSLTVSSLAECTLTSVCEQMTQLRTLKFGADDVLDAQFADLAKLTRLTELEISTVSTSGIVALEVLGRMRSLRVLTLVGFCGVIDCVVEQHVGSISGLTDFRLRFGDVDGSGLARVVCLPELTVLELSKCSRLTTLGSPEQLAGTISSPNLRTLMLSHCVRFGKEGVAALAYPRFLALAALDLSGCTSIPSESFVQLARNQMLVTLNLADCPNVKDSTLESLAGNGGLPCLRQLNLSVSKSTVGLRIRRPQFTGTGFANWGEAFPALVDLDLSGCEDTTDNGLSFLGRITSLTTLNLSSCHQLGPKGLAALRCLPRLTTLKLRGCSTLDSRCVEMLSNVGSLTSLDLECALNVSAAGFRALTRLTRLRWLSLRGCSQLTDDDVLFFGRLAETLEHLDLSTADLSDVGLGYVAKLTRLTSLNLSFCFTISDAGLAALRPLQALSILDLAETDFHKITEAGIWLLRHHYALSSLRGDAKVLTPAVRGKLEAALPALRFALV